MSLGGSRKRLKWAQAHPKSVEAPGSCAASGGVPLAGAEPCAALPGLRRGAPGRRASATAHLPDLSGPSAREQALEEFDADVLAANSRAALESRLKTAKTMLAEWNFTFPPLTQQVVRALGASLKAGRYRSAHL